MTNENTSPDWENKRMGANRDQKATEDLRKLMNNPNTPLQYSPKRNPNLPEDLTPPPGMEKIHGTE